MCLKLLHITGVGSHETPSDLLSQHCDCSFCLLWKTWWYRITFSLSAVKFLFSNLLAWKGNSFLIGSGYGWSVTNSMCNMLPVTCPSTSASLESKGMLLTATDTLTICLLLFLSVSLSLEMNSICPHVITPSYLPVPTSNSESPSWFVGGNLFVVKLQHFWFKD